MTNINTKLFLGRPKNMLTLLGVWLVSEKKTWFTIYMVFIMTTQFSFVLFEFIYIVGVWGDLGEVSEASYLLFTQASVCLKSTVFLVYENNLKKLMELMESELFEPQTDRHEKILKGFARTIKNLCAFFLTSATTTCTLWAMIPLFDDAGNRSFPFRIWMPVTPETSPNYELGYIYQMLSIYISAGLFIGIDSVALSMIMFGCGQLDLVINKLEQVKSVPVNKIPRNEQEKILKNNNKLLIECIKQHQAVVNFIEMVEDTYHGNIFFQLSGTIAIMCNIMLRISIVDHHSVQFFSMCNYMVTMLSQLFLYCWCGNELTSKSEELRHKMYQCPWYEQNVKYRRSMWLAMERMKRPIIFKAGHYISLSRPTFVTILRCSYSYFAVLNRTRGE